MKTEYIYIILLIINLISLIINLYVMKKTKKIRYEKLNEIKEKQDQYWDLNKKIQQKQDEHFYITIQTDHQRSKLKELKIQKEYTEKEISNYYEKIKNIANASFNEYETNLDNYYKQKEEQFNQNMIILQKEQEKEQKILDQLKQTTRAATAARRMEEAKENEWRFYSIYLTDKQIDDIVHLLEWKQKLNDPTIVSKIVWSNYYLKPVNELCNRVLGTQKACGIYKITNKATGKVYIGQSVNIADRWKAHIKCGLGIDASSTNKLYNAMQGSSLWYWIFELLETCDKTKLNEREKFWIDFYQSDKTGYNMTKGGS